MRLQIAPPFPRQAVGFNQRTLWQIVASHHMLSGHILATHLPAAQQRPQPPGSTENPHRRTNRFNLHSSQDSREYPTLHTQTISELDHD